LSLFLTTQPGWAFATLSELRRVGVTGYVPFFHRDSSLVADVPQGEPALWTPADVWGLLLAADAPEPAGMGRWGGRPGDGGPDATARFSRDLDPRRLRSALARWLDLRRPGRYSVGSEVWGETALHRGTLRDLVHEALEVALPGWRSDPAGGIRFLCKADARAALLGVRLATNLSPGEGGRPGALREHLACALLEVAGAGPDGAVLDPFVGSGTILRAAWQRYGVRTCLGYDVDGDAVRLARASVRAPDTRLTNAPFTACDPGSIPPGTRLVSNLPFGARFREVPTGQLVRFLVRCQERLKAVALLLGREQGEALAGELGLARKNVLVLGQPASVLSWPPVAGAGGEPGGGRRPPGGAGRRGRRG
jgi:hypothetical protein